MRWWHDIETFFHRLKRLYKWNKECLWTNWDFDAATIFPLLKYKLERVQDDLVRGCALHEPEHLKALRIAIKLSSRVSDDYHETKLYAKHEAKWGEIKTQRFPLEGGGSRVTFTRANADTEDKMRLCGDELLAILERAETWRERDERLLFEIIRKYYRYWWD